MGRGRVRQRKRREEEKMRKKQEMLRMTFRTELQNVAVKLHLLLARALAKFLMPEGWANNDLPPPLEAAVPGYITSSGT